MSVYIFECRFIDMQVYRYAGLSIYQSEKKKFEMKPHKIDKGN